MNAVWPYRLDVEDAAIGRSDIAAVNSASILDRGGLNDTTIFASGNIDEYKLEELMAQQTPIDGFGIGTHMDTSADAPYLDCAYKLPEYAGIARRKRSEGKVTWPGRKQVYRNYNKDGIMSGDTVTLENTSCAGQPLLQLVMQGGKTVTRQPTLIEARAHAQRQLNGLPVPLRQLSNTPEYPVIISAELQALAKIVDLIF